MLDQISSPSSTNNWNLDALGNWTGTGPQTRTFNAQNQIASISGHTTPTYDNNGNMKKDETGVTYTYDAWNRMVTTSVNGETFTYDADSRRPALSFCSGEVQNSYYDVSWQDLEDDDVNGSTTTKDTYVWSQSYIDDMVARDQSVNGGTATRIYAQQDANHDVTALVNTSGTVVERFDYDPYGKVTVLSASWGNSTDQYSWAYLFQGGRYDSNAKNYNFRNRDYRPTLGVWLEEDSLYSDGMDLYQFERSGPADHVDPTGQALPGVPVGRGQRAPRRPNTPYGRPPTFMEDLGSLIPGNSHDRLGCISRCIEANDPLNLLAKGILYGLGGPIPKSLLKALGMRTVGVGGPGASGFTTIPSVGSTITRAGMRSGLRAAGRLSFVAWLAYADYMAGVDLACAAKCACNRNAY